MKEQNWRNYMEDRRNRVRIHYAYFIHLYLDTKLANLGGSPHAVGTTEAA